MLDGKNALINLLNGSTYKAYGRFYRLWKNNIEYSDNNKNWRTSNITVNDFINCEWELFEEKISL